MKENVDKQIETLVDKAMDRSSLERPSFDFTSKVMSHIDIVKQNTITTYRPLISKQVWGLILLAFVGFLSYIIFVSKPETSDWLANFNFNQIDTSMFSSLLNNMQLSKIVTYGIGLFSIMCLVQISFLKNYFDKRIKF